MNFSSKINITVFFIIINLISVKGFPYTFYVETSEFNDNVYIIQNVVGDVSGNQVSEASISETEIKTNNSQSKNQNNDIERYNNNLRDYSKVCTNLKLKPKSNIRKEFEENSYRKGISETSLKKAKDYWDSNEVSYGVDPCIKKLDTNHLFSTVNSLNRLLLKENINLAHLYPKVYFFNTENIKNIESFSSVSKDKYLKELLVETSNLRQELLSSKGSEIIYNNYYHYLLGKSSDQQLDIDEKIFLSNFRNFKVNSKILKLGYTEKSFFHKKNDNIYSNKNFISEKFFNDISSMMDLFFISSEPKKFEVKVTNKRKVSSPIITQFSDIMNNL
tara:strand:- start:1033 stop:2028 length:996 start_codon:yes stop_codon:yes gene_type:complete